MFLTADSLKSLNAHFQILWDFKRNVPVSANVQKCASLDYQIIRNQMSRKFPALPLRYPSLWATIALPKTEAIALLALRPPTAGGSSDPMDVLLDFPHSPHTNRQVSITGSVWFPILESLLSVPLCNLTVVQQHKISSNGVSAGRDPKHRNPWLLYPHSLCVLVPVVIFVLVAVSGWPDAPHAHWWFFAWGSRCFPSPRTQCATYTEATCTRCICKIRIGYFSEKDSLKAMKKLSDFRWP